MQNSHAPLFPFSPDVDHTPELPQATSILGNWAYEPAEVSAGSESEKHAFLIAHMSLSHKQALPLTPLKSLIRA